MGEVAVVTGSNLPESVKQVDWTKTEVSADNLILPRLQLMQGLSELVHEGKAKLGDIVKSSTGEILASKDQALEILPLTCKEYWIVMRKEGTKLEFSHIETLVQTPMGSPREFIKEGSEYQRIRTLDFYVLIKKEIAGEIQAREALAAGGMCDPDLCLLPAIVSFKRSSFQAGKEISTAMLKAKHFGMPSFVKSISLSSAIEKTDLGTFAVFTTKQGVMSTVEELEVASHWYKTITAKAEAVKVTPDEEVIEAPAATETDKF